MSVPTRDLDPPDDRHCARCLNCDDECMGDHRACRYHTEEEREDYRIEYGGE